MPPDDLVESWGGDEQKAIEYSISVALRGRGVTYSDLAKQAGMNKSQLSLMRSGERGVPVGRFCQFVWATGSLALPKLRAAMLGCVLKPKTEWGAVIRERNALREENAELQAERKKDKQRLAEYEG